MVSAALHKPFTLRDFRPLYDGDDCGTQRFSVPDGSTADGKATGGLVTGQTKPAAIPSGAHHSHDPPTHSEWWLGGGT